MAVSRDQIIAAAIHHLNRDPAASMAELAEAAGVSRATLHRHFAGREELLLALGRRALDRWEQAQRVAGVEEAAASRDPSRISAALGRMLVELIDEAEEYDFALTDIAMNEAPELRERSDVLEAKELELYRAAQQAGVLRPDLPVRWISNTVYGLLLAVRDSLRRGDVARRDLPQVLHETFFHGAAARDTRDVARDTQDVARDARDAVRDTRDGGTA
ncbi:AcrR family transcriptional regulator [Streptosporangium becharense]|uniref:TetR/AcrR family transcriptional regulator n=1 Tax=Streptosporangium becharense TaxID=1816182 RepID=UPI00160888B0|nr:TetR/AcrR family transcriptional regulator [Streptosporangium becharense]MBB2909801.1 AcrR family transcriptional regulator [Streptosporangium becharense]